MDIIFTKNFGSLQYDPEKAIEFPAGLPGYRDDRRFVMLDMKETEDTFFWLQSLDNGELCFPLMDVYKAMPDYDPLVDPAELADLGEIAKDSLVIYNIAVIPEDISLTRVNLRAPIIINLDTRKGKQIICANEEYAVKHLIIDQLRDKLQESASC
jgi:flagellar assembly factor FliW